MTDTRNVDVAVNWLFGDFFNDREIAKISAFIKDHYQAMYLRWSQYSDKGERNCRK